MQEFLSCRNSCEKILWKWWKTGIPETPSKTMFLWKIPLENTGKKWNPQESFFYCFWAPKINSCQTGITNLAGRIQEGGTGTICFGKSAGYIKKNRQDKEGLGRWSRILLRGTNGHNMRTITAYNQCKNKNVNLGIAYQQQCRYFITKKKDFTCSLNLFLQAPCEAD